MNYTALFRSSLWVLLRNRTRSLLIILGVSIGIASVVCILAISGAAQSGIQQQFDNLGDNLVWIEAGARIVKGVTTGTHTVPSLVLSDAAAIQRQISLITQVSPHIGAQAQVIYGNQNWFTTYHGVAPEYFGIKRWSIDQGALFQNEDVDRAAGVCVLGHTVRDQLFGAADPIGKEISILGVPCKVVATLAPKGLSLSGQDQDDTIMLPVTTAQKKLKGVNWIDDIVASAASPDLVKLAGREAAGVLRDRHRLRPEESDDFIVRNPEDLIQAQLDSSRMLTNLLLSIASISLMIGGIGIMNVMLVSVTERTREIGLRAAVGATERAIRFQFLGEAIILSLAGGAAGVVFGIIGSFAIGRALNWPIALSLQSFVVVTLFSIALGVFFGFYPARKASMINPIDALRYE